MNSHLKNRLKSVLFEMIDNSSGIKATDVATRFVSRCYEQSLECEEMDLWLILLNELVDEEEIVELEYIVPSMEYRIKSMYFPKGTKLYLDKET